MTNHSSDPPSLPVRIYRFYRDGFRAMTLGRTLWKIILLKLFILFAVLKFFFFPDFLATRFSTDSQRAEYVIDQLTPPAQDYITPYKENDYDRKP